MAILARAKALEAQGRDVIHLEVGEPDFATAPAIIEAGIASLQNRQTHYTAATGLPELRQAIARYYQRRFGLALAAERVIVTSGASAAIQLALLALNDPGEAVMLTDPGYPCNRNIAALLGLEVQAVAVDAASAYQLTAAHVHRHWNANTRCAMVASPSNPCGTLIDRHTLQGLLDAVAAHGGHLIVDEIYQGLVYDADDFTALSLGDDSFVINSFSKYFGMTGWRLGWMVVPEAFVDSIDRLCQNLFLAPPTMAQHAAIEALSPDAERVFQARRQQFRERRDYLLPALQDLGFDFDGVPGGAFYLYARCDRLCEDSHHWVRQLLEQEAVAVTPGCDFGHFRAGRHVRFAYTRPIPVLQQAVSRIARFLGCD